MTRAATTAAPADVEALRREVDETFRAQRARRTRLRVALVAGGFLLLVVSSVVALAVGGAGVGLREVVGAIGHWLTGAASSPDDERTQAIVLQLRLPRVLLAVVAGAALSVAGVVMQGLLRNPLVSPFTLGISPAAAFGAALGILFLGGAGTASPGVVAGALVTSLACAGLILALSTLKKMEPTTLILLGMALTQLFVALTAALQYVADEQAIAAIVRWTFGTVNGATWPQVAVLAALVAALLPVLVTRSGTLNAIAFAGDDAARALGVHVSRTRFGLIAVSVVLTAVTVSFTGVIGFVGLVGPHIARLVIGADHRFLVPFSAVSGGLLVVVADTLGRVVLYPAVVPVGIVVAFVGAPLFLNLVLARKRSFL